MKTTATILSAILAFSTVTTAAENLLTTATTVSPTAFTGGSTTALSDADNTTGAWWQNGAFNQADTITLDLGQGQARQIASMSLIWKASWANEGNLPYPLQFGFYELPTTITLKGSNDLATWSTIITSSQAPTLSGNTYTATLTSSDTTAYRYIQFTLQSSASYWQYLNELNITPTDAPAGDDDDDEEEEPPPPDATTELEALNQIENQLETLTLIKDRLDTLIQFATICATAVCLTMGLVTWRLIVLSKNQKNIF